MRIKNCELGDDWRNFFHSKVMAKNFFSKKMPCILPYKAENTRSTISRQVRDLTQI